MFASARYFSTFCCQFNRNPYHLLLLAFLRSRRWKCSFYEAIVRKSRPNVKKILSLEFSKILIKLINSLHTLVRKCSRTNYFLPLFSARLSKNSESPVFCINWAGNTTWNRFENFGLIFYETIYMRSEHYLATNTWLEEITNFEINRYLSYTVPSLRMYEYMRYMQRNIIQYSEEKIMQNTLLYWKFRHSVQRQHQRHVISVNGDKAILWQIYWLIFGKNFGMNFLILAILADGCLK